MSTFSPDLRIELIGPGEQAGTWGTTTNTNLGTLVEDAIAGYIAVSVTSADQALTALDGAADQARNAIIALTTTTTANFAVYAPPASKQYIIYNTTDYTATIYNSTVLGNTTAAGLGAPVSAGSKLAVFSDGTDFRSVEAAGAVGVLPVINGGTGVTTKTGTGSVVLNTSPTLITPALGTPTALVGTNITGTAAGLSIGGNAATATLTTNATTSATCSGNAATATNPQSGGSFITSSNIGSQSVNFASSASYSSTAGVLSTASGSAPSYSARAWVNFNGTGSVAIRASGNVSSITDNGVGNYTVNFATAMSDANYSVPVSSYDPAFVVGGGSSQGPTTLPTVLSSSSVQISTRSYTGSSNTYTDYDVANVYVAIFR